MFGECSCSCVDGILADGASWSIDVDTGESAKSTALGAAMTRIREIAIDGGEKYSSNIGVIHRSSGPELSCSEAIDVSSSNVT
uniref:Uncharacterized protein n=1 Tax=Tanacetum cinerariifolium TaxID=118510 RepID=A0A699K2F2_TANCI|nr:hypothetical protein [Tanacetum cinerariifolium]